MSKKASPALIGSFVIGAIALAAASTLFFGAGTLFEERTRFVIFFDGSVVGLSQGSPVMFRGVTIGRVARIDALYYPDSDEIEIPVYIDILGGRVRAVGDYDPGAKDAVPDLIERGMRAQLQTQSLVTGQLFVSLDMHPDRPIELLGLEPDYQEIPSIPSTFQVLEQAIMDISEKVQEMPLKEIGDNLAQALEGANELINSPEVKKAVADLGEAAEAFRDLARNADGQIEPAMDDLMQTSDQARKALVTIEQAVTALRRDVGPGSPMHYQILSTLEEVSKAARSLRAVADAVAAEPDSLIFGRRKAEEK